MTDRTGPARRPLPRLVRAGLVVMAFGFVFDLSEHGFVSHANDVVVAGFPFAEHAAHLVVFIGMLAVLAGIVVDGLRISRGRSDRPERSDTRAHR